MIAKTNAEWNLPDLLRAAGIAPLGAPPSTVSSITADSRTVSTGACFIAVAGGNFDGHRFVDTALQHGAVAAIVERDRRTLDDPRIIAVPDSRLALARLAAAFYRIDAAQRERRLGLIGVTGTNGKSTVCALIRSILQAASRKTACFGTIENDSPAGRAPSALTTLPPVDLCHHLSLAVAAGADSAVMEVSSHASDQKRCDGLAFSVAVFTNLTHDHLDYHKTLDAYALAKKRLFDGLEWQASAVINADDPRAELMVRDCHARVIRFGSAAGDVTATVDRQSTDGTTMRLHIDDRAVPVHTHLIGAHNVYNCLAAAAAAHAFGASVDYLKVGLERVEFVSGRLQRATFPGDRFAVLIDYAHTPDALQHAIDALRPLTRRRLICVFGCGGDRDRAKRPVMGRIAAQGADVAVLTSDNPRSEEPARIIEQVLAGMPAGKRDDTIVESDRRIAIHHAIDMARAGDVVLIAGKGHEAYQIIGAEKRVFSDLDVARQALQATEIPA